MIKIGIVGFAHPDAGSFAGALKASAQTSLEGIADSDLSRGRKAAEEFSVPFLESPEALFASDIDAVVICAENSLRHMLTLGAASAGKHVLCEMPMATSVEDAEDMIRACRDKNTMLAVALPYRCSTSILRAREIITSGKIGNIVAFKIIHRAKRPSGWLLNRELSGGGAILHLAMHAADMMSWLAASQVTEVYAEVRTSSTANDNDDCGILTLTLKNGVFGTIDASWLAPPMSYPAATELIIEITGTEGFISVDAFGQKVISYSEKIGRARDVCWGDDMYVALVSDFADAISGNRPPAATGQDGVQSLKVALAAYRSAEDRQPAYP